MHRLFSFVFVLMITGTKLTEGDAADPGWVYISDMMERVIYTAEFDDVTLITELTYSKVSFGEGTMVTAVEFDPTKELLYWAEFDTRRIMRVRLNDSEVQVLDSNIGSFQIALDIVGDPQIQHLFYDDNTTNEIIVAIIVGGRYIRPLEQPDGPVYGFSVLPQGYPNGRKFFWTDGQTIYLQSVFGSSTKVFIELGPGADIRDMYIDTFGCRVYWYTLQGVIESCTTVAENRTTHYVNSNPSAPVPLVIDKLGDILYWTDGTNGGLGAINLVTGLEEDYITALPGLNETFNLTSGLYGLSIKSSSEIGIVRNRCCSYPCQNGGTCVRRTAQYTCLCLSGLHGKRCQTDINECKKNPCDREHGTCNNTFRSYECGCVDGFQLTNGTDCENIDDCNPDSCMNGGTCLDGVNSFTCACPDGYNGSDCSTDIDDCTPDPCLNGGTCSDGINSFTCNCIAGYDGNDCSIDIDDCSPDSCMNGGTCLDGVNSFTCVCPDGYNGSDCSTDFNHCRQNPCMNGGTCSDGIDSFTCDCFAGFKGSDCSTVDCDLNPCKVGSTCANSACTCQPGFKGVTCETVDCENSPCLNGAPCVDDQCRCSIDSKGVTCWFMVGEK